MRAAGFTDPAFSRLSDLAHLLAGLTFPPNRQPSAEAGMRRAMSTLRISNPESLLRAVEIPGNARDVVLAELTVGESYFFRDAPPLDAAITDIVQARAGSDDPTRPIRIWSAGCASGEEPYTIALMLRERGWVHGARIIGTDVAIPRLAAAKRGRYTRWALRGVSDERIARWFHRSGTNFDLDHTVRDSVEFRTLNLVCDAYGSLGQTFDLVLCRNVMIYFGLGTVADVARKLLDSLDEDGWLVLGASDPPLASLVECQTVMTPVGVAYRRANAGRESVQATTERVSSVTAAQIDWRSSVASNPALPMRTDVDVVAPTAAFTVASMLDASTNDRKEGSLKYRDVRAAYERADYPTAESMAAIALAGAPWDEDARHLWILYVRAVANQGRLHEAGELCARALESHPLDAELHYLHATLLLEAGWESDAAIAARRSIYLDRKLVVSHLLLGDALARIGEVAGARTSFGNAINLLAKADPRDAVRAADGVPAARLRQIAALRLRDLPDGSLK